jgi:hypothetical protein
MISTGVKAARFVRYVLQLARSLLFRSSLMRGATDNMHGQKHRISHLFRMLRLILGLGRRRLQ